MERCRSKGTIGTLLRRPRSGGPPAARDQSANEAYELYRITAGFHFWRKLHPWFCLTYFVLSLFQLLGGRLTLVTFALTQLHHILMGALFWLASGPLQPFVERNMRLCGSWAQVFAFSMNMWVRAYTTPLLEGVQMHRTYIATVLMIAAFMGTCCYVPKLYFYGGILPSLLASWLYFHIRIDYINPSVVFVPVFIGACMSWLRGLMDELHQGSFFTARELEETKRNLEQVLSTQQSMLSAFFDASCVCNSAGCVTQATPQVAQLLACEEGALKGACLSEFAPSPREQERLREFFASAWDSGVSKTTMIQTSLSLSGQPCDAAAGGTCEVKIYCIRLPDVSRPASSANLWENSGLFMGLQEISDTGAASAAEVDAGPLEGHSSLFESRSNNGILFDAGSATLEVIDSSPIFADACRRSGCTGLLDFVPEDVAKEFDDWIYDEVQQAPMGQRSRSTNVLTSLRLRLPYSDEVRLMAKRAWLEINPTSGQDDAIPVVLQLSGLCVKVGADGAPPREGQKCPRLGKVPDDGAGDSHGSSDDDPAPGVDDTDVRAGPADDDGAASEGCDDDGWQSRCGESSVMPDDSASQFVRHRLARPRRLARGSGAHA